MAEVIPQINIDGTKIKNTWTEKEYVTDEVYNALNKAVIDLKNNNNLLDSNSILFREEYNSSSKNLNNAIHQGVYSFTNSAVNAPSGVTGGNLFVTNTSKINQGSSVITQIAFCHNGAVYARTKNASENFTSWNKLAYITDNVASATKASRDSEGNAINTTYLKRSGGTMNGDITMEKSGTRRIRSGDTGVGIYFSSSEFHIYDWKNNTDVLGYNSTNQTLTAVKKINGTATNATNANTVNVAQQFKFGVGGDSAVYRIFARTSLDAGDSHSNSTFIITSTGNFGSNILGSYIVNISNRGGARMYVRELIPDGSNSTTFGYYISGSYIYFGLINTSFSGECSVTPLNISYSSGHEVGNYKNDSAVPSGWKNVTIEKLAPKDSPAFSGTPTTPTPSTSDNSTKIANTSWVQTWVKKFINNLSSNLQVNWSGTSFTVPALNISGLAQQTGYINFGKLFGGLKIQWGNNSSSSRSVNVKYPIAFTSFAVPLTVTNDNGMDYVYRFSVGGFNTTSFNQILVGEIGGSSINRLWIAVGV